MMDNGYELPDELNGDFHIPEIYETEDEVEPYVDVDEVEPYEVDDDDYDDSVPIDPGIDDLQMRDTTIDLESDTCPM